MRIQSLFTPVLMLIGFVAFGQQESKEQLQRRTQNLLSEIDGLKREIAAAEKEKKASVAVLRAVEKKLALRNQIVTNYKTEVWMTEREMLRTFRDIDTLKKEIDMLKDQYAQSVIYAYKNRSNYDLINFLFSGSSVGDALKRLTYLKTYRSYRAQKAGDILRASETLRKKVESLTVKRQEKQSALGKENDQLKEIEAEKNEKNSVVNEIRGRENELKKSMAAREKEKRQVQAAIAAVIKREKDEAIRKDREDAAKRKAAEDAARKVEAARLAEERAKNPTTSVTKPATSNPTPANTRPAEPKSRPSSVLESTPEGLISSQQFEGNKGSLPWPVDKGMISFHYGNNKIPGKTRDLDFPSEDLTIQTNPGAAVKAIFDGEVLSVINISNRVTVVLRHGKYFSSYGHMQSASVSKGQKVKAGTVVGSAAPNAEGEGEVWLRIENDVRTFDPEGWIRRR